MNRLPILARLLLAAALIYPLSGTAFGEEPASEPSVLAVSKALPAVVNINTERIIRRAYRDPYDEMINQFFGQQVRPNRELQQKVQSLGSGFIVDPSGYIVTNEHVVDRAEDLKIQVTTPDGKTYNARYITGDPSADLALLKIESKTPLPFISLKDLSPNLLGQSVLVVGNPLGYGHSVARGILSATNRALSMENTEYTGLLQTDAAINPGNSGGPLVNLYGEVIGINAMIRGMNTGIGFAIPINLANRVKDHLISEGKFTRSWIGVKITDLKENQTYKGLDPSVAPSVEDGVMINEIESSGPASKSGLKPFDIVVAVDNKAVRTPRELKDEISVKRVGQLVTLDVVRGNKHVPIKIKTEALPSEEAVANTKHKPNNEAESTTYGLSAQSLTKELAEQYNVEMTTGVIVTAVEPNTPASEQGIKAGDIVTEINRRPVSNGKEFREALKDSNSKSGMVVNLISNGTSKFVVLKDGQDGE